MNRLPEIGWLDAKRTAANQLTDYIYDNFGLLAKVDSKQGKNVDRSIKYSYDKLDRVVRVDYTKHWSKNRNR